MQPDSPFASRLAKNARRLQKWASRQGLTAYRLFDRDMPEYAYTVDWYDGRVLVGEFPRKHKLASGAAAEEREKVIAEAAAVLSVDRTRIFVKTHTPQKWGERQYEPSGTGSERFTVEENGLKFWVKLGDYLDTGLFMDHRDTRARVRAEAKGKRFLNLFAYTGSFTVYAAAGGAKSTTTVDLSNTYLDWAEDNLQVNGLGKPSDELIRADAAEYLAEIREEGAQFDLVVLDPPSFSASKRAARFEIQRDHVRLIDDAIGILAPGGVLYFSTNFRSFQLDEGRLPAVPYEELTPKSLPEDFHQKDIHRCWRFERP